MMQGKPIWSSTWNDSSRLWAKRRARGLQADALHCPVEELAVLGHIDGLLGRANHLHAVRLQHPLAGQVQGAVEGRLPPHGGQQRIRLLHLDNARHGTPLDGLDIGGVGHGRVSHDRGRVGVHQDYPVALFPQGLAGLGAGIIEFTGLADDDRARTQNQDALDVSSFRHTVSALPVLLDSAVPPGTGRPPALAAISSMK